MVQKVANRDIQLVVVTANVFKVLQLPDVPRRSCESKDHSIPLICKCGSVKYVENKCNRVMCQLAAS
jgi:hypothetical protein